MARKGISFLNGNVNNGTVNLSWYKATPLFEKKEQEEFKEFSIYRKPVDDFTFGSDYEEFFCGLAPEPVDLIYCGPVECSNNRKYLFQDRQAEIGKVYGYFVKTRTLPPVGPVPLKIRDPEVWWSYETLKSKLQQLQQDYPAMVNLGVCGRTVEGREILSLKIGSGVTALGLAGAMHPGEAGPELIISALEKFCMNPRQYWKNAQLLLFLQSILIPVNALHKVIHGICGRTLPASISTVIFRRNGTILAKNTGFQLMTLKA